MNICIQSFAICPLGSVEVLEGLPGDKITSGMHSLCLMSAQKLNEVK